MALNKSKGNMYGFITHTWNAIKGECFHDCSYCYMKRWGKLNESRFDFKELKTNLGSGNFIFVGSSCDIFARDIPELWIKETMNHCKKYPGNKYFFQTKNVLRLWQMHMDGLEFPKNSSICTTIETNRRNSEIMGFSPRVEERVTYMNELYHEGLKDLYVTIEPILDFDLGEMLLAIENCLPKQVNIGSDSGGHKLPEPSKQKLLTLIEGLEKFTIVNKKKNLNRLLK